MPAVEGSLEEGTFFIVPPELWELSSAVGLTWFRLFLGHSSQHSCCWALLCSTPATSGSSRGFLATRHRYHFSKAWKQGGTRKDMDLGSLQGLSD